MGLMKQACEILDEATKRWEDRTAVKNPISEREWSYNRLLEESNALANALIDLGISEGSHVGIIMQNRMEYFSSYLAVVRLGGVVVPMNNMLSPKDVKYQHKNADTEATILDSNFVDIVKDAKDDIETLDTIIGIGEEKEFPSGIENYRELIEGSGKSTLNYSPETDGDDLVAIYHTGGTTGPAKGVMMSQENFGHNIVNHLTLMRLGFGDRVLISTPLPHTAGLMSNAVIAGGGTTIFTPGFDPSDTLELIEKEEVTHTFMVPTMIYQILKHPEVKERNLDSLKTTFYGAAPIARDQLEKTLEIFGRDTLVQGYGQMETPDLISYLAPGEHEKEMLSSCGFPLPQTQVKIVDDEGKEVEPGEEGEILTRAPHQMVGYYKEPEKTKETMTGDNWIRTGDMGKLDENGFLYLMGRKKNMVISGGMNVYPPKVEDAVSKHPKVAQAAVIGVPDEKWGEAVKAIVTLEGGIPEGKEKEKLEQDIIDSTRDELAKYEVPKSVDFLENMPLTVVGKIDRSGLKEKYWEEEERDIH